MTKKVCVFYGIMYSMFLETDYSLNMTFVTCISLLSLRTIKGANFRPR